MVITYESIQEIRLNQLIIDLSNKEMKSFSEVKLIDLILNENVTPFDSHKGIYLFFDSQKSIFIYVGKTSKQNFIKRVASHFTLNSEEFLGTILKKIKTKNNLHDNFEALKSIKNNLKVLLITVINDLNLEYLEKILIHQLGSHESVGENRYNQRRASQIQRNYLEGNQNLTLMQALQNF